MAANRGVTLFVLLLYCCHRAEQPVNTSSDEILVQEILNPNKSSRAGTPRTATTLPPATFKGKNADTDEDEQVDAEPPDNAQFSPSSEDKILSNESSANDSYQVGGPEDHDKKNSKNDPYESLSVLDKILKKIGKFSGNLSSKLKRTSKAQRAESGQRGHQLREISVKNEILTE
ncbi:sperm acrosome-associated protein 7 isoform X2 [Eptesicus fuscus]|uniref:sperm acrosome-associated protein 7 isoform X2 n=1 Tax=Eptesicus fuscus TaxID=29078 RepID=UPI002403D680|nr:sperm acrosome-associated protein 7 isoform X2 [Eptesicus fuscus]